MSSPSQPNDDFTKRDELLAGRVLGNLSSEETELLAHESISAEEENLLIELKAAHSRMETHSAPPLSAAVRERLLHSSHQKRTFNPQSWFIGVLLLSLAFTGGELYRSKLQIANQRGAIAPIARHPGDRAVELHATAAGNMQSVHGEVLIRPGQASNLLTLNRLPQAPKGRLYRLWAVTPEGVKGCVHFLPDQGGNVTMTIPPQPTGSATKLLISLDPISSRNATDAQPEQPVLSGAI